LQACGCRVLDADLAPTPTVEMGVLGAQADGGIILSASHNPEPWNALKLLNRNGEFLTPAQGEELLRLLDQDTDALAPYHALGDYQQRDFLPYHIRQIVELPYIVPERIAARRFRVVVDGINSIGGIAIPALLEALGVEPEHIEVLNREPLGYFAHNPEPLPEYLGEVKEAVRQSGADLGIVVDPDADRLALIQEDGTYFGEELTQVLAADFILSQKPGPVVTNLSSSRAIEEVARRYSQPVFRSAVGEIHVVEKMKEVHAVIGGEGNGGVILPDLHYGRDALVGTAIVLQLMADTGEPLSALRERYPQYVMIKNKLPVEGIPVKKLLKMLAERYRKEARVSTEDGVKIDFEAGWVHLRPSNTEPILRIYTEAQTEAEAQALARQFMQEVKELSQVSL